MLSKFNYNTRKNLFYNYILRKLYVFHHFRCFCTIELIDKTIRVYENMVFLSIFHI